MCELIKLVLENNHFHFGDDNYIQKLGTAMGSSMAQTYASLFIRKFEAGFLKSADLQHLVWYRFLDDILIVLEHSKEELENFIENLNNFHPTVQFIYDIPETTVSCLDVNI